ncbi:sulfotransferase [Marmoricola sp. RAF53]|uniref:sulfotransferase n=1 Tax=Marmoricola sp. RAF53 TaxID=3233059 RepID=UPI003F94FC87
MNGDGVLAAAAKAVLPAPAKDLLAGAIRTAGTVSADLRPLPDFLIVGAKRAGTTTLWRMLLEHPQVMPMVPRAQHRKSSDYFVPHHHRGPRWYAGHFPTAAARHRYAGGARVVCGEASPLYLFDPRVPARVRALLPGVRVVVLLRDPVERAFSHHRERVQQGVEGLTFPDALAAEPYRTSGELDRMRADPRHPGTLRDWFGYRERGRYLDQLEPWYAAFGADQVQVLLSEDLYADPGSVVAQVHEHLGVVPQRTAARHENLTRSSPMPADTRAELRDYYRPHNEALAAFLGRTPRWQ